MSFWICALLIYCCVRAAIRHAQQPPDPMAGRLMARSYTVDYAATHAAEERRRQEQRAVLEAERDRRDAYETARYREDRAKRREQFECSLR